MEIKLYNSLTKKIEHFTPLKDNEVRMYSCGPTVYNFAHIGNMRAFLFADFLQRVLRVVGGYKMRWVMNITDIDDKTIRDSRLGSPEWKPEMGQQTNDPKENLRKFTDYYLQAFLEDINKLGIKKEHFYAMPRATDYINQMQDLIVRIIRNGFAYISGGSVYFDVNAWRQVDIYGKLYKIDFDNFISGHRIDADQYEREQASDFVLWKAYKEGEPYWDFYIDGVNYPGRPGWHIECSTMEYEILGLPFDIHTGGVDLKFPHHEDEIAQSKAGYKVEPTVFWCHNEFLEVEGEKMSKSLGNFFTLRDLLARGLDPIDIRFAMLSAHYSSKYNFTFDGISAARKARLKVQDFIYDIWDKANGEIDENIDGIALDLQNKIFSELANDLHSPKALAALFSFINDTNLEKIDKHDAKKLLALMSKLNDIYSAWEISERKIEKLEIPDEIIQLAEERLQAKKAKNYALADDLRNKIIEKGYFIKDTKDGYEIIKSTN